ncbi:MAG: hypothetical protein KGD68_01520 [Candidatus Lokiarchaeota archaeon]|nr:hypothetical protein [Candidatus Lokiarchaeota archaeon]
MEMVKSKGYSVNPEYMKEISDIYSGEESIRFDNRHPIYRTLMKLEFEDVLRSFSRK